MDVANYFFLRVRHPTRYDLFINDPKLTRFSRNIEILLDSEIFLEQFIVKNLNEFV